MENANARRALVVIDVQNDYIDGPFRIEYPEVSDSLPNIARAMDAAHQRGIPIVMVQHISPESSPIFARGSHGAQVHASIASKPYQHHIEKAMPSCFAGTDFGAWLKANEIDTLAVVGYMTHNCNDSTIRQAMHEGYKVEFLADAAGSLPYENKAGRVSAKEIHNVFRVVMQSAFAAVVDTKEWIAGLDGGAGFERDNVFTSNQRYLATRAGK